MINIIQMLMKRGIALFSFVVSILPGQSFAQKTDDWKLEKWPADLETDFALSSLPKHLQSGATVYLLDPGKGFYVGRQGSNGFICFVSRTEWEWAEFRSDLAAPISYDAEGAKTIFPVYMDVAAMRASGKFTAVQIKDSIIDRIKKGIYKAPARTGVSYMLAPEMRIYPSTPDNKTIITVSMPHYMFYAPYVTFSDVGIKPDATEGPMMVNPGEWVLGERKGPFGYIIVPANEAMKTKILNDNKDLLKRLADYKSYFKISPGGDHHT
ncbi:MAG TPA: hypothetical protein VGG71_05615 [Chitinophagaceae bacterium]